jgi:putative transposase
MNDQGEHKTAWPHAPLHKLSDNGTYFVTCGTYKKLHHFRGADKLAVLHRGLLKTAMNYDWQLEAWAVFSNHYHFVAHSPAEDENAESLSLMLKELHSKTSKWVNRLDDAVGRQVWHNFRETRLTFQRSYLARLNYVHNNAVKHKLVQRACLYPWCSAGWLERAASQAQVNILYGFKADKLNVYDEFEPCDEW